MTLADRAQGALLRVLTRLPAPAQNLAATGVPDGADGLRLHHEARLVIALAARAGTQGVSELSVAEARDETLRQALATRGAMEPVERIEEMAIGARGVCPARHYVPYDASGGLLVYFHGGGFVVGNLETCESVCRFLARHAGVSVLAVDYRKAPEHRFPAAADDAVAALEWARDQDPALGVDPARIAVGGDSAGGTLATVAARRAGGAAFQLLIYPVCDLSFKRRSYKTFAEGFLLTEASMDWYRDHYVADEAGRADPSASPILADDLAGLPPAYVCTAGFDPLRDEAEEYARGMADAGVRVALRRHEGLVHSFANWTAIGRASREAMLEAAGALRQGLA